MSDAASPTPSALSGQEQRAANELTSVMQVTSSDASGAAASASIAPLTAAAAAEPKTLLKRRRGGGTQEDPGVMRRSARLSVLQQDRAGAIGGQGAEDAQVAAVRGAGIGGVIVSGFGSSRVEDVAADERRRVAEGAQRGDQRRNDGTRGRMTTFSGEDLDRSKGGAWHARRR